MSSSLSLLQSLNSIFNFQFYPSLSPLKNPKPQTTACNCHHQNHNLKQQPTKPRTTEPPNKQQHQQQEHGNTQNPTIKMPTAPWMQGPLLLPQNEVLTFSKPQSKTKKAGDRNPAKRDRVLTERVRGGRGRKAMNKVIHGIEKLKQLEEKSVKTQFNAGGFSMMDRDEGMDRRMPWEREERVVSGKKVKEKVVTAAEMCLDVELLRRLRDEARKMRVWVKVKKIGVSESVVDEVNSIWRNNELVMLKFDLPLCRNMDRAREIVELKTGGLVVWSKKDSLVVYRGCHYKPTSRFGKIYRKYSAAGQASSLMANHRKLLETDSTISYGENMVTRGNIEDCLPAKSLLVGDVGLVPTKSSLYESETDRLLDGLGPRFVDWWYPKPLPVDADLLPEVVSGFTPPLRICPPGVRAKLTDEELTYLRNLARPLPTHFVLGRNTKLQGLAAAILKLWQKSIIAKLAVKWGIPNTNNEMMASELKNLTGGVLLLRNKFIIVLYRGKDFLPGEVADLVLERESELNKWYLHEEDARLKGYETSNLDVEASNNTGTAGTLLEFRGILSMSGDFNDRSRNEEIQLLAEKERLQKELRSQEYKLAILKTKIKSAEKELSKLNAAWQPSEEEPDIEWITVEERECFRKIALKMNGVLVLGRRGVFDGVIEGLHQHWKHREIAKVITMQRTFAQVIYTANMLERESGGVLVSVDKQKEGHAIILYRGKNYRRPLRLGENLLDKRKALKRSLEMQRIGSLKFFAYQREKAISELKAKLADLSVKWEETDLKDKSQDVYVQDASSATMEMA